MTLLGSAGQLSPAPAPRVLCVWLPNWPLQHRLAVQPELRRQVVLLLNQRGGVQRVAACSGNARRAGVRPGMPAAEAEAVLRRNGAELVHLADDPPADQEALQQLARWCERFSPRVGWQCVTTVAQLNANPHGDCLYLDVAQLGPIFGGERSLLQAAQAQLRRQGYAPRLGLADTVGGAWAVAHYAAGSRGWVRIAPGRTLAAVRCLPILCLRLAPAVVQDLHRLGVRLVRQLLALPRASLPARLGREPLWRLDQAWGTVPEVILPVRPQPDWRLVRELDPPLRDGPGLQFVLRQLLEELADQLRRHGRGALRLHCYWQEEGAGGAEQPVMEVGLFQPSADPRHLEQLVNLQLQQQVWEQPLVRVTLQAQTAALPQRQAELFAREHTEPAEVAQLIDRLSSRLGRSAVARPQLVADPLPERSCHWAPCTPETTSHRRRSSSTAPPQALASSAPWQRPLWLLDPPAPLQVQCTAAGAPQRTVCGARCDLISRCWGPERIETGWWRGASRRRDYYRVETTLGERYWIFRDLQQHGWFLQGVFG